MASNIINPQEPVRDFANSQRRFNSWKGNNLRGLKPVTKELIRAYIADMERGSNVNGGKGGRSYTRLNTLRSRIPLIAGWFEKRHDKAVAQITADEALTLFGELKKGKIMKANGKPYKSPNDYITDFKSFWNWHVKHARRVNNQNIDNIMVDVAEQAGEKPEFNYFSETQFKQLCQAAKFNYRVLMTFLYDSGCRAPSEALNIRVKDLQEIPGTSFAFCNIRDEVSKTFGRKFKLMFSWTILKEFILQEKLAPDDFIFKQNPIVINRYLRRLGFKILGAGKLTKRSNGTGNTPKPDVTGGLTLYDFRHASACYWLPRYKNETALRYRFGWRTGRMAEYYSQFLGMKDTISEDDLLDGTTKTQLERQIITQQRENEIMKEQLSLIQEQLIKLVYEQEKKRKK